MRTRSYLSNSCGSTFLFASIFRLTFRTGLIKSPLPYFRFLQCKGCESLGTFFTERLNFQRFQFRSYKFKVVPYPIALASDDNTRASSVHSATHPANIPENSTYNFIVLSQFTICALSFCPFDTYATTIISTSRFFI